MSPRGARRRGAGGRAIPLARDRDGSQALGQLLVVRLAEAKWSGALGRWLGRINPAGILLSPPFGGGPSLSDFLRRAARALPAPPILSLEPDAEAASVLGASSRALPAPAEAARRGPHAVERLGEQVGAGLRLLGFNLAFAPPLDLARQAFGTSPTEVARAGGAYLGGLRRKGILACARHFPGLGQALLRRSPALPVIDKSMAELWRADLVPFRDLLPRIPLMMVSPAAYKAYDFDHACPAIFSEKIVEGLLRVKLGYEGVACADAEDPSIRGLIEPQEAALRALRAGCDLVLVGGEGGATEKVLGRLVKAVESGQLPARRAEQALRRLRRAKRGLAVPERKIG